MKVLRYLALFILIGLVVLPAFSPLLTALASSNTGDKNREAKAANSPPQVGIPEQPSKPSNGDDDELPTLSLSDILANLGEDNVAIPFSIAAYQVTSRFTVNGPLALSELPEGSKVYVADYPIEISASLDGSGAGNVYTRILDALGLGDKASNFYTLILLGIKDPTLGSTQVSLGDILNRIERGQYTVTIPYPRTVVVIFNNPGDPSCSTGHGKTLTVNGVPIEATVILADNYNAVNTTGFANLVWSTTEAFREALDQMKAEAEEQLEAYLENLVESICNCTSPSISYTGFDEAWSKAVDNATALLREKLEQLYNTTLTGDAILHLSFTLTASLTVNGDQVYSAQASGDLSERALAGAAAAVRERAKEVLKEKIMEASGVIGSRDVNGKTVTLYAGLPIGDETDLDALPSSTSDWSIEDVSKVVQVVLYQNTTGRGQEAILLTEPEEVYRDSIGRIIATYQLPEASGTAAPNQVVGGVAISTLFNPSTAFKVELENRTSTQGLGSNGFSTGVSFILDVSIDGCGNCTGIELPATIEIDASLQASVEQVEWHAKLCYSTAPISVVFGVDNAVIKPRPAPTGSKAILLAGLAPLEGYGVPNKIAGVLYEAYYLGTKLGMDASGLKSLADKIVDALNSTAAKALAKALPRLGIPSYAPIIMAGNIYKLPRELRVAPGEYIGVIGILKKTYDNDNDFIDFIIDLGDPIATIGYEKLSMKYDGAAYMIENGKIVKDNKVTVKGIILGADYVCSVGSQIIALPAKPTFPGENSKSWADEIGKKLGKDIGNILKKVEDTMKKLAVQVPAYFEIDEGRNGLSLRKADTCSGAFLVVTDSYRDARFVAGRDGDITFKLDKLIVVTLVKYGFLWFKVVVPIPIAWKSDKLLARLHVDVDEPIAIPVLVVDDPAKNTYRIYGYTAWWDNEAGMLNGTVLLRGPYAVAPGDYESYTVNIFLGNMKTGIPAPLTDLGFSLDPVKIPYSMVYPYTYQLRVSTWYGVSFTPRMTPLGIQELVSIKGKQLDVRAYAYDENLDRLIVYTGSVRPGMPPLADQLGLREYVVTAIKKSYSIEKQIRDTWKELKRRLIEETMKLVGATPGDCTCTARDIKDAISMIKDYYSQRLSKEYLKGLATRIIKGLLGTLVDKFKDLLKKYLSSILGSLLPIPIGGLIDKLVGKVTSGLGIDYGTRLAFEEYLGINMPKPLADYLKGLATYGPCCLIRGVTGEVEKQTARIVNMTVWWLSDLFDNVVGKKDDPIRMTAWYALTGILFYPERRPVVAWQGIVLSGSKGLSPAESNPSIFCPFNGICMPVAPMKLEDQFVGVEARPVSLTGLVFKMMAEKLLGFEDKLKEVYGIDVVPMTTVDLRGSALLVPVACTTANNILKYFDGKQVCNAYKTYAKALDFAVKVDQVYHKVTQYVEVFDMVSMVVKPGAYMVESGFAHP